MNNPLEMIRNYTSLINNNPMLSNAVKLAQKGDSAGVEQIARNLCKAQGKDFDTEFNRFMTSMH